ncbi:MAG: response regulator transcription factor [Synechococcaceae cyanobacterium]|nr:response regulator transcription factor [Synechococcaceae cyanobacterium]
MNPGSATIHLVDDDESFRRAVTRLLQTAGFVVRGYASAAEFLLAHVEEHPGCVLLDVHMPGLDGMELQASLAKQGVALPVVFITGHGDIPMSVRAMKTGAVDFLTKPVKKEALLAAVETALAQTAPQRIASERARKLREHFAALTPREREVFERVTAGKLNKEIAAELGTAERTVKAHRANVMEKFKAESLAELVHIAAELRMASDPASISAGC